MDVGNEAFSTTSRIKQARALVKGLTGRKDRRPGSIQTRYKEKELLNRKWTVEQLNDDLVIGG